MIPAYEFHLEIWMIVFFTCKDLLHIHILIPEPWSVLTSLSVNSQIAGITNGLPPSCKKIITNKKEEVFKVIYISCLISYHLLLENNMNWVKAWTIITLMLKICLYCSPGITITMLFVDDKGGEIYEY